MEKTTIKVRKKCLVCPKVFRGNLNSITCSDICYAVYRGKGRKFRRYANRTGHGSQFTAADWYRMIRRAGYRCMYCSRKFEPEQLTLDHIVPLSRGGSHSTGNVGPSCAKCNVHKGNKTYVEWKTILSTPIYNSMVAEYRRKTTKRESLDLRIDIYGDGA